MEVHQCLQVENHNAVKIVILLKAIHRFKTISIKNPKGLFFFLSRETHTELQGGLCSQTISKRNKVGRFTFLNFKIYNTVTVVKTVCYWHEERLAHQLNKTKSSKLHPGIYGQLIFNKGAKTVQ